VFPFYASGPMSTLGLQIDQKVLERSHVKYPEIARLLSEFMTFDHRQQKTDAKVGLAAIMNVLVYHPGVAGRVKFNKIQDKSEVSVGGVEILDCTNAVNYHFQDEQDMASNRVEFAPNMLTSWPSRRQLFWGTQRPPGPLHGQWSTAQGAMGQVLGRHPGMDNSSNVTGCLGQCYSVFYFARFHLVSKYMLFFQYSPTSVQLFIAYAYEVIMRVMAITGFTYLFFNVDVFMDAPHQSPFQNFGVIQARWEWFSKEMKYAGPDKTFPVPFADLPGVSRVFDFHWIAASSLNLKLRMMLTFCVTCLAFAYSSGLTVSSAQLFVASFFSTSA